MSKQSTAHAKQEWEYKVVSMERRWLGFNNIDTMEIPEIETLLIGLGKEHWELVGSPVYFAPMTNKITFYFKRPKHD